VTFWRTIELKFRADFVDCKPMDKYILVFLLGEGRVVEQWFLDWPGFNSSTYANNWRGLLKLTVKDLSKTALSPESPDHESISQKLVGGKEKLACTQNLLVWRVDSNIKFSTGWCTCCNPQYHAPCSSPDESNHIYIPRISYTTLKYLLLHQYLQVRSFDYHTT